MSKRLVNIIILIIAINQGGRWFDTHALAQTQTHASSADDVSVSCEGANLDACWLWCNHHPNHGKRLPRFSPGAEGCEVVDRDFMISVMRADVGGQVGVDATDPLAAAVQAYAAAHAADKTPWPAQPTAPGVAPRDDTMRKP